MIKFSNGRGGGRQAMRRLLANRIIKIGLATYSIEIAKIVTNIFSLFLFKERVTVRRRMLVNQVNKIWHSKISQGYSGKYYELHRLQFVHLIDLKSLISFCKDSSCFILSDFI